MGRLSSCMYIPTLSTPSACQSSLLQFPSDLLLCKQFLLYTLCHSSFGPNLPIYIPIFPSKPTSQPIVTHHGVSSLQHHLPYIALSMIAILIHPFSIAQPKEPLPSPPTPSLPGTHPSVPQTHSSPTSMTHPSPSATPVKPAVSRPSEEEKRT